MVVEMSLGPNAWPDLAPDKTVRSSKHVSKLDTNYVLIKGSIHVYETKARLSQAAVGSVTIVTNGEITLQSVQCRVSE